MWNGSTVVPLFIIFLFFDSLDVITGQSINKLVLGELVSLTSPSKRK